MPLTNVTLAEEALSLPAPDRVALARLLIDSLSADQKSDSEIREELRRRLNQLLAHEDQGLTFDEVFRQTE